MKSAGQRTGYDRLSASQVTEQLAGYCDYELLDASAGDAVPTMLNCREIKVDAAGIIKIDYIDKGGVTKTEVLQISAAQPFMRIRNVTKLYRYYTAQTAGTAKSYGTDGVLVTNAIKLLR